MTEWTASGSGRSLICHRKYETALMGNDEDKVHTKAVGGIRHRKLKGLDKLEKCMV